MIRMLVLLGVCTDNHQVMPPRATSIIICHQLYLLDLFLCQFHFLKIEG